jgi:tetratricopeptide (TPR) repeat protein
MSRFPLRSILFCGCILLLSGGLATEGRAQPDAATARADAAAARADSLAGDREYGAAVRAYRRAQGLYREAGASVQAAKATGQIGVVHYRAGDLEAALSAFRDAAAAAREAGAREEGANLLNNIGLIEWRRGQYDRAQRHFEESIQLHRAQGNRESVAKGLNNLANVQDERGQFDLALHNYREALEIARDLDRREDEASYLNNLGLVLRSQGRHEDALRHHRKALEMHRALDNRERAADALNNIGIALKAQGRYAEALDTYREALEINRALDERGGVAANLSNIGELHQWEGRHEEARSTLRKALRINRARGDRAGEALTLAALGEVYRSQEQYATALDTQRAALGLHRTLGRRTGIATALDGIALTHYAQEQYAAADSALRASIGVTETLLETASGADRRDFVAQEIGRFYTLVMTRIRAGRDEAALRAYERGRARLLAEQIAEADSSLDVPPVDSLRASLGPDEAAVLYATTDLYASREMRWPFLALVVTRDSVRTRAIPEQPLLRKAERRYAEALRRLRARDNEPWRDDRDAAMLRQAKGVVVGNKTEGTLANLVRLYRHELSVVPARRLLSDRRRTELGQYLHSLLVRPLRAELSDVDELVIVPDGVLSYLPFETLSGWGGTRVVERWDIRYVQSLRVHHLLRQRDAGAPAPADRSLLALGGVVYNADTYAADTSDLRGTSTRRLPDSTVAPRPSDPSRGADVPRTVSRYRELGYGPERWRNLTGTLEEVRALRSISDRTRLLVGPDASERSLYQMSRSGTLDDYRVLHFATHGFVIPETPRLSALVLSEVGGWRGTERERPLVMPAADDTLAADGYLSMGEIPTLDLDAEFVGLSACRTGLGRIYRGSGAVSLAQAFLRAGAGSVAVSLWAVNDASTSQFMTAVYRRAWDRETSWSEAIAETKRAFARGRYGERLQSPRFWAPFVHYGWERPTRPARK